LRLWESREQAHRATPPTGARSAGALRPSAAAPPSRPAHTPDPLALAVRPVGDSVSSGSAPCPSARAARPTFLACDKSCPSNFRRSTDNFRMTGGFCVRSDTEPANFPPTFVFPTIYGASRHTENASVSVPRDLFHAGDVVRKLRDQKGW